jgi:murein DD-endopeptidase MepM/ murein hydrolase activator NlpD
LSTAAKIRKQLTAPGNRPVVALLAFSLVVGAFLAGAVIGELQSVNDPAYSALVSTPVQSQEEPAAIAGPEDLTVEVAGGDTLESLFREYELSLSDLNQIMQLDPARRYLRVLVPGDLLQIRHEQGLILNLERELDIAQALKIARNGDSFTGEVARLPIEYRQVTASGMIRSSLFEAAADARVSEQLIMKVAGIFSWDIDFVRDVGQGDEFALVYEELWRNGQKLGEGEILAAEFINRGNRFTAMRYAVDGGKPLYYNGDGRPMRKAFVRAPVRFTRISSGFNPRRRHPVLNTIRAHQGVDYAAPSGTPVIAAGSGKVIFKGWKGGYGNTVILQHAGNVTTLYGHLSRFSKAARYGARVDQGDVIGTVGATGLATAPHLHFEYRKNGVHLDPRKVLLPDAEPLQGQQLVAFRQQSQPLLQSLGARRSILAANLPLSAP